MRRQAKNPFPQRLVTLPNVTASYGLSKQVRDVRFNEISDGVLGVQSVYDLAAQNSGVSVTASGGALSFIVQTLNGTHFIIRTAIAGTTFVAGSKLVLEPSNDGITFGQKYEIQSAAPNGASEILYEVSTNSGFLAINGNTTSASGTPIPNPFLFPFVRVSMMGIASGVISAYWSIKS